MTEEAPQVPVVNTPQPKIELTKGKDGLVDRAALRAQTKPVALPPITAKPVEAQGAVTPGAPVPANAPASKPEEKKNHQVPLAELHSERDKTKAVKAENETLKTRLEQAERNEAAMKSVIQQYAPKPAQAAAKDFSKFIDEDLAKQVDATTDAMTNRITQLEGVIQQMGGHILGMGTKASVDAFKSQQSDYDKGYAHVRNMKMAEAQVMGLPEDKREAYADAALGAIAKYAMANGMSAPQKIYELAGKLGYNSDTGTKIPASPGLDRMAEVMNSTKSIGDIATDVTLGVNATLDVKKMVGKTGLVDRSQLREALKRLPRAGTLQ